MMNNAKEDRQEQREKINKLPLVSLTSGILATILFFTLDNAFSFWIWLMSSVIGFICGLYYLIKVKTGRPLERICAILGTSLSGLWLCILWCKS